MSIAIEIRLFDRRARRRLAGAVAAVLVAAGATACEPQDEDTTGQPIQTALKELKPQYSIAPGSATLEPGQRQVLSVSGPQAPFIEVPTSELLPNASPCSGVSVPGGPCVELPADTSTVPDKIRYPVTARVDWELPGEVIRPSNPAPPPGAVAATEVAFMPRVERHSDAPLQPDSKAVAARVTLSVDPATAQPKVQGVREDFKREYSFVARVTLDQLPVEIPTATAMFTHKDFHVPTDEAFFVVVDHGQGLADRQCTALKAAAGTLKRHASAVRALVPGAVNVASWVAGAGALESALADANGRVVCVERHAVHDLSISPYELNNGCWFVVNFCRLTPDDSVESVQLVGPPGTVVHFFNRPGENATTMRANEGELTLSTRDGAFVAVRELESYQCPADPNMQTEPQGAATIMRQPPRYLFGNGIFHNTISAVAYAGGWQVKERDASAKC